VLSKKNIDHISQQKATENKIKQVFKQAFNNQSNKRKLAKSNFRAVCANECRHLNLGLTD
ncbi:MAG: hypothetical protein NC177_14180, partial [Ruminococcus flavefaciens]|nr:hypothetical protein [Ruminococcus flavefaciens]